MGIAFNPVSSPVAAGGVVRRCRAAALAAGGILVVIFAGGAVAREAPSSFADLAERLSPAVVNVSTTQAKGGQDRGRSAPRVPPGGSLEDLFRDFLERQGPPRRVTSLGSGFIIDEKGYVVTNNHVIADADEITVTLSDDSTFKAELVGKDPKTDLALLKLDLAGRKAPLPTVKFGDSDKSRVGDWVMAIGNPFGLGGSVSVGIISARARSLNGPYDDFLQTDAAINKGNSGGPMFNMDGEVIGINTAIYSPSGGSVGIGFAIPSNLASSIVDQLREFGRTKRGWLGVRIQTVDEDLAKTLSLDKPRGALIADVTPGGPAEKSGIKARDVILSFDGKDIPEMRKLSRVVAETKVGSEVDVVVWRDGKRRTVKVKVGELEESERIQNAAVDGQTGPKGGATVDSFGLVLSELSADLRDRYDIPAGTKGVVVTKVLDGSVAGEKGIRAGDVIVDINQHEVKTPADVETRVKEARDAKRKSVLLLIDRQGDLRFVGLRIDS
ncbi:MAG: DegQ family serine endoprotease [Reyranellaceae bacterium]